MEPKFVVLDICPHRVRALLVRPPRGPLCCWQLGGAGRYTWAGLLKVAAPLVLGAQI